MKVLILSDIHGNREAFRAVTADAVHRGDIESCILLGDLIDYGMHSNEVLQMVKALPYPILCNLCGNHEDAVLAVEYGMFSSERGRNSARHTKSMLNGESWEYMENEMNRDGLCEFECHGCKCLAVHGCLEEHYWKSIQPEGCLPGYEKYDYVFSGHSHIPHCFEKYYEVNAPVYRNRKKTIFINPGSVGQPRNHNPMAQYAVLDTETEEIHLCKVKYDVGKEQLTFTDKVDAFYRERLALGI